MKQKIIDLIFEGWSEGDTGVKRMEPPIVNEITDAIIDKVMATGEDALFIEENINEAVYEVEKNAFSCGFALCLELISGRLMGGMVNE